MNKYERAIISLSKKANKETLKVRPMLAGAYIKDNETQICNGIWWACFNKDYGELDGLVKVDADKYEYVNLKSSFAEHKVYGNEDWKKIDFNIEDVKAFIKENKDKDEYRVNDEALYNPKYLKDLYECFEEPEIFVPNMPYDRHFCGKWVLWIKGQNGYGILLPRREG